MMMTVTANVHRYSQKYKEDFDDDQLFKRRKCGKPKIDNRKRDEI